MTELYRRQATERVSSPDQLDRIIQITSPLDWLAVAGIVVTLIMLGFWAFFGRIPQFVEGSGVLLWNHPLFGVNSIASGQIVEMRVRTGDVVREGAVLAFVQPAQSFPEVSRVEILSGQAGRVSKTFVRRGDMVSAGTPIVNIAPLGAQLEVVAYISALTAKRLRMGMDAQITPSSTRGDDYGVLLGTVSRVSENLATASDIRSRVGSDELAKMLEGAGGGYLEVTVRLHDDLSTVSGYRWSTAQGPPFKLTPNTVCAVQLVRDELRPIELVIPELLESLGGHSP